MLDFYLVHRPELRMLTLVQLVRIPVIQMDGSYQGCVSIYDVVQQSIFNWWSQPIAHFSLFFSLSIFLEIFNVGQSEDANLCETLPKSASSFDPALFDCGPPLLFWKALLFSLGPKINKLWLTFQIAPAFAVKAALGVIHKSPIYCQSIKSRSSNKYPFQSAPYIWIRLIFADTISSCFSSLFK